MTMMLRPRAWPCFLQMFLLALFPRPLLCLGFLLLPFLLWFLRGFLLAVPIDLVPLPPFRLGFLLALPLVLFWRPLVFLPPLC
jgi:hypothetical protein